ncbi:MAG: LLM class flavin-dependent oxidoreductase, partial [Dehalococcoidia bacterium]|nr:LLM class flavin-dependent oxidoreductase [Dehalococcoidia bacterium]
MSSPKVKIGVQLPSRDFLLRDSPPTNADELMEMAERVEAAGLDSVWVGDSLTSKPRLEPLAALAAVAART